MDLMQSLRILRKRWILTTLLLVLALGGTAAAFVKLPHTYVTNSTVVLLASQNASKPNGGNPYLSFNSSLPLTADVVRRELLDPRTALDLAARGYTAPYLVVDAPDTSGPVLLVTVTGKDKTAVEHTLYGVTAEIGTKLLGLQATIRPINRIRVVTLSVTPKAKLSVSKLARPLVVILGLGMVLTFAVPLIVDAQISRRSRKGSARRDAEIAPPPAGSRPNRDSHDDPYDRRPGPSGPPPGERRRPRPPEYSPSGRAPSGRAARDGQPRRPDPTRESSPERSGS